MDPPNQFPKDRGRLNLTMTSRFFLLAFNDGRDPGKSTRRCVCLGPHRDHQSKTLLPPFSGEIAPSSQKVQAVMVAANRGPRSPSAARNVVPEL
jgi:hypothetical protein